MADSYVDTTLLSANRKQSVEFLGGNTESPALWTNELGSGLRLNIGDKVSVESSYISEIGNESATIEVKGAQFDSEYSSSHTIGSGSFTNTLLGYFNASYSQTSVTNRLNDNEINLTYSFYKNTNGEYYFHLPRKGLWSSSYNTWTDNSSYKNIWCDANGSTNGSLLHPNPYRLGGDYRSTTTGPYNFITAVQPLANAVGSAPFMTYPVNDGSRYTLFVRDHSFNSSENGVISPLRDPALFNYLWYKQTIKLDVNKGFNSPQNVAAQITNKLGDTTSITQVTQGSRGGNPNLRNVDISIESPLNKLFPCASGYSTEYNKASKYHDRTTADGNASWDYDYESSYATIGIKRPEIYESGNLADVYYRGDTQTNASDDAVDGTGLHNTSLDGSFTMGQFNDTDTLGVYYPLSNSLNSQYKDCIPTSLEWNETNLNRLDALFKAEAKYPDIFKYDQFSASQQNFCENGSLNISTDKVRFLHMNTSGLGTAYVGQSSLSGLIFNSGTQVITHGGGGAVGGTVRVGQLLVHSAGEDRSNYFSKGTYIIAMTGTTITLNNPTLRASLSPGATFFFVDRKLGHEGYTDVTAINYDKRAPALFFDYNILRADSSDGTGDTFTDLYLGFGVKLDNGLSARHRYTIGFRTDTYMNGMSPYWWSSASGNTSVGQRIKEPTTTSLGFDRHFNAFGTCAMSLYNGDACSWDQMYNPLSQEGAAVSTSLSRAPTHFSIFGDYFGDPPRQATGGTKIAFANPTNFNNAQGNLGMRFRNQIYVGANQPQMLFNGAESRFSLARLHTPEYVGNLAQATTSIADASAIVFKINKRFNQTNWTREISPYDQQDFNASVVNGASAFAIKSSISTLNQNILPYSIMDAMSGIFIEDYGVTESDWDNSLWSLMGFSYSQFHQTGSNRLVRTFDTGLTTSTPTTNAQVSPTDVVGFPKNQFDVSVLNNSAESFFCRHVRMPAINPSGASHYPANSLGGMIEFPTTVQNCSSVTITAQNLPRKMISPVYLIKSSLIDGGFIGGEQSTQILPVMSVVPKNSGFGDFYNGPESQQFTITNPRIITEIKTSICDADGTESRVDDSSMVVYKVVKGMIGNGNVLNDILNPPKK